MRKYLLLIFAAGLFLLTGCQHKELCYNHNHTVQVNVVFDWTKSPGADPKSMVVYLFPEDGSDPLLYQLSGAAGGTITVPLGRYQMLALNSDTESILYRGAGLLSSFEIYTRDENISTGMGLSEQSEVPRASGTEQEPVKLAPDMVWSGRYSEEVEFSLDEPVKEVVFTPEPDVIDCSVEILNVKNLDKII